MVPETNENNDPPPTPQSAAANVAASAGPSSVQRPRQQRGVAPTPSFSERGRGRGNRGGREPRPPGGLVTVFVCVVHDRIYCQECNVYERSTTYWARH